MSLQAILTLAVLLATVGTLASQRLRSDVTALLATLFLIVSGVLEAGEAFSAFGQPVIIIVASIYIIGAALYETGVATILAEQLLRFRRGGYVALLTAVMVTAGLLSAILSSLLVTAILLPAVLRLARKARVAPAQLLLPMATASSVANQLTLIAAISNVAINDYLVSSGQGSLGLFTLTPYGLASLAAAILWFVLVGRHLLPRETEEAVERPSLGEVEEAYELEEQLYQVRVRRGSDLIGQRLDEIDLRLRFRLNVVAIQPARGPLQPVRPDWVLEQDDLLIVEGDRGDVHQAASLHHLQPKGAIPLDRFETVEEPSMRLAEVMVPYRSNLVGQSVAESRFRDQHGLNVLAVHREGQPARGPLQEIVLGPGDTLLVQGALEKLRRVG
ncbi:MAG: SLC13 family permease, partial [Candidatus Promineifilaceae bacterium]|nr:SLC13 family permease [Candidatus Promineifilaceae bacterium]